MKKMYKIKIKYIDNTEDNFVLGEENMVIVLAKTAKLLSNTTMKVLNIEINKFEDKEF